MFSKLADEKRCLEWPQNELFDGSSTKTFIKQYELCTKKFSDKERVLQFFCVCTPLVKAMVNTLVAIFYVDEGWAKFKQAILQMFPDPGYKTVEELYYQCCEYYKQFEATLEGVPQDGLVAESKKKALENLLESMITDPCPEEFEYVDHSRLIPAEQIIILFLSFQNEDFVNYILANDQETVKCLRGISPKSSREYILKNFYRWVKAVPPIIYCEPNPLKLFVEQDKEGTFFTYFENRAMAWNMTRKGNSTRMSMNTLEDFLPENYRHMFESIKLHAKKTPLTVQWLRFSKATKLLILPERHTSFLPLLMYHFTSICPLNVKVSLEDLIPPIFDKVKYDVIKGDDTLLKSSFDMWIEWQVRLFTELDIHVDDCLIESVFEEFDPKGDKELQKLKALFDFYAAHLTKNYILSNPKLKVGLHTFIPSYIAATKPLILAKKITVRERYLYLLYFLPESARLRIRLYRKFDNEFKYLRQGLHSYIEWPPDYEELPVDEIESEEKFCEVAKSWLDIANKSSVDPRLLKNIKKQMKLSLLSKYIPLDERHSLWSQKRYGFELPQLPMSSLDCVFCGAPDHSGEHCSSLRDFEKAGFIILENGIFSVPSDDGQLLPLHYPAERSLLESQQLRVWVEQDWSAYEKD